MAVRAAAIEEKDRSRRPWGNGMLYRHMALRAEPWVGNLEQPVVDGSVRLVTVSTIFKRRRMRPKKWAAPLGVTGVAVFVDTRLLKL